ncbi:MAG: LLM class flavin-dependent oxidoreductase [Alphaproteobacteria bacterium]|nr:LLM class flavin-dependent oxidoreductase [Alphaproteobacteria bacterium]
MTQRDPKKSARQIYTEMVEQVQMVEQIGFEIAWFAEHHFSNYCLCPSPLTMLTYMAAKTSRIKLAPGVIVAPLYEPIRMLEDIAVADNLSDGRLVLGFGSGYQEYEFHKFGVDLKEGRNIFLEKLDLVERFLAGEPFGYQGKLVKVTDTYCRVRPLQKRIPIYIAGLLNDPETQRRVARSGYIPFFTTGWSTLEQIKQTHDKVVQYYVESGGDADRTPFAMQRYMFVTDDKEEALQAAEGARYIRRIALSMRQRYGEVDGGFLKEIPASDEPPLDEIARRMIVGSPATVVEKLGREFEALRPTHVSCFMGIPGIPQARVLKSMERFGAEVMPQLAKQFGGLDRVGAPASTRQPLVAD